MHKLITAAAIATGILLAVAPVQADHGAGTVKQKGTMCYTGTKGADDRENGFGYWSECARSANTNAASTANRAKNRHSSARAAQ